MVSLIATSSIGLTGNKWSEAARRAALEARRRSLQAHEASKGLEGHGDTETALRESGLGFGRSKIGAFNWAALHHHRAAAEHRRLAGIDQSSPLNHLLAADAHDQAAAANLAASQMTESVNNSRPFSSSITGNSCYLRHFGAVVGNEGPWHWVSEGGGHHCIPGPPIEGEGASALCDPPGQGGGSSGGGGGGTAHGGGEGSPHARSNAERVHDAVAQGHGTGDKSDKGGKSEEKGVTPEEMSQAFQGWSRHGGHGAMRAAESPHLYGAFPSKLAEATQKGAHDPAASHALHHGHEGADIYTAGTSTVSGIKAALGGAKAAAVGAQAAVGESLKGAGHEAHKVLSGHGHEQLASGGEHAATGTEGHGHEAGGHEGGAAHHFAQAVEAIGAIYGAKAAGALEKLGGLDKKASELYARMKVEHGAAAPYLHVAATAATIGLKMALGHALAGPVGTALGAATGMLTGGVVGLGAGGSRGAIKGAGMGALTGAAVGMLAGHGEQILGALGEGVAGATAEGAKGFGSFMTPGIGLATLWVADQIGKLGHTFGLYRLGRGIGLKDLHNYIAGSKLAHKAEHFVHKAGGAFEKATNYPIKAAGSIIGKVKGGLHRVGEGLHVPPATGVASGYLNRPVTTAALWPQPISYVHLSLIGNDKAMEGGGQNQDPSQLPPMDLNNPGVQIVVELVRDAVNVLRQTPLWDKINTPQGAKLVAHLLAS